MQDDVEGVERSRCMSFDFRQLFGGVLDGMDDLFASRLLLLTDVVRGGFFQDKRPSKEFGERSLDWVNGRIRGSEKDRF